jgi:hypothetical protein
MIDSSDRSRVTVTTQMVIPLASASSEIGLVLGLVEGAKGGTQSRTADAAMKTRD